MITWPKLTVSNYPEMLRKLSCALFIITAICICLLRLEIASIDHKLSLLDTAQIKVLGEVSLPSGTVAIALLAAMLSESIKLHDKISDLFCIRRTFDYRWILIPMALCSGATIGTQRLCRLAGERNHLMRKVFYEYVSSTSDKKIDSHLITQALTAWSWYWICVEAMFVIVPTAMILALYSQWMQATFVLVGILIIQLLMVVFRLEANKYAEAEWNTILSEDHRKETVKAVFNAL